MTKFNVKTGDTVVVISGKDAGKQGKVLAVNAKTNRITVENVNIVSKHQKARKAQEKSQIVKREGSIDVSNVMIVCSICGKATRVKHAVVDGKSVRVCKCGAALDKAAEDKKVAKKAVKAKAEKETVADEKVEKVASTEKAANATEKKAKVVKSVKATTTTKKQTKTTPTKKAQRGV